jgi:hypothetical protein
MSLRRAPIRLLVLALLALAIVAATPGPAGAKSTLQIGFIDNRLFGLDNAAYWRNSVALKVGFARWDINWRAIAPTQPATASDPADPAYDWSATDAFVRQAAQHGLQDRVMFTVWTTPNWASGTGATSLLAVQMPRISAWREFVRACATRYSGTYTPPGATTPLPRVVAWETWNEPNGSFAFQPQRKNGKWVSPRNYVKLLNALKREVNDAVPFKPVFVAGALYKQGSPTNPSPIRFMRGMKAAGARFDVLSIHPYNNVPRLGMRDGKRESRTNPNFIGIGNFETFITLANRIFGRRYPIWVTEWGLPTPAPQKTQYTATLRQQSRFTYDSILKLKRLPQVERAAWFLIQDELPRDGAWYTTGLETSTGQKKPAYDAWIAAAGKLRRSPIR